MACGLKEGLDDEYCRGHELTPGIRELMADAACAGLRIVALTNDVSAWSRVLRSRFRLDDAQGTCVSLTTVAPTSMRRAASESRHTSSSASRTPDASWDCDLDLRRTPATKDFCHAGFGYRLLAITASASLKGQELKEVTVVEDGGIVPTSCLTETLDGKFGERFVPVPGEYVDFQLENHPHTPVGAEVIVFVGPNRIDEFGATNRLVHGLQGLFVRIGDRYVRTVLDTEDARKAGIEATIAVSEAQTQLAKAAKG